MDHIVRRARNGRDPIQIMERIDTVARIVFDSHSHIDHMEILGELSRPAAIGTGINPLNNRLAILPAKDKASGVDFELFDELFTYMSGRDYKVVHLVRRNLLDSAISFFQAKKSNQYYLTDEKDYKKLSISIDYKYLTYFFDERSKKINEMSMRFSDFSKIDIFYTDLVSNKELECRRILSFLDLEYELLECNLIRQNIWTQREVLRNYDELKD